MLVGHAWDVLAQGANDGGHFCSRCIAQSPDAFLDRFYSWVYGPGPLASQLAQLIKLETRSGLLSNGSLIQVSTFFRAFLSKRSTFPGRSLLKGLNQSDRPTWCLDTSMSSQQAYLGFTYASFILYKHLDLIRFASQFGYTVFTSLTDFIRFKFYPEV